MALLLPQQSEVLFAYSVLADLTPGYTAFNDHQAYYNAHGQAGYEAALNSIFAGHTNAQLGAALLANTGLGGVFTAADAEAYIASHAANRAGAMIAIANALYYYAGADAALLAAHNAYVTRIDASYAYSATSNNTSSADLDGLASTADTFTLTHSSDKATANIFEAPQVYTPGGDDRINSLQDEDNLTGTGANPTLTATLGNANDNGATIITPTLNGIETLNAAFTGSGGAFFAVTDLDVQDATGLKAVNITRVSAGTNTAEIANIMNPLDLMTVTNSNSNQAGGVEFSYTGGALAGANTGRLELKNVQLGALNVGTNTSGVGAALGVGTQGYENLTIASNGSPNAIGAMGLPMDTGTDGKIVMEGAANLTIGTTFNIVNPGSGLAEGVGHGGGIAGNAGRLAAIDASAMTGSLSINIGNAAAGGMILSTGKAGTSGQPQNVTITGTKADDAFWLNDVVGKGDVINGDDGNDTLMVLGGGVTGGMVNKVESIDVQMNSAGVTLNFDNIPDATLVGVRNASNAFNVGTGRFESKDAGNLTATLQNLTAAQAGNLVVSHGTTFNNDLAAGDTDLTVQALLKSDAGASDTVGVTIQDGGNADVRFNFVLDNLNATTGTRQAIENVTFVDNDTESNSVLLPNFAKHTGTLTYGGGLAGQFFSLDLDTALTDVTGVTTGATLDKGEVQQGLLGLATNHEYATSATAGNASDFKAGNIFDVGALATQVRLGAAKIDASAAISNVVVRVDTNLASVVGAQEILMGAGNDTVIFDLLNDTTAGLTISDTVKGGDGSGDTLAIDGNGILIQIGASEWTNVSGFENLRLVGNGVAAAGDLYGQNNYNITLTNDFIGANGNGMINIISDNDVNNDTAKAANTATTGVEGGVTIDGTTLDANHHFSFNGEEDGGAYVDRFILSDANVNGMNVIDGGAVDNTPLTWAGNADILEVRNKSTVTVGDLANVKNIGIIAATNDAVIAQTMKLQLNDTVVDALVDSYHTSTALEAELLFVRLNDPLDIAGPVGGMALDLDATALTSRSQLNVSLDFKVGAVDKIALGYGMTTVANWTPGTDVIVVDISTFGLNADKDDIGLGNFTADTNVDGTNSEFGVNAASSVNTRLFVDNTGANLDFYYDPDGSGAQTAVMIASFTGAAAATVADIQVQL